MSSITYTSTATYPMAVGWKCTQCGRFNAKTCKIQWSASASKQGLLYSKDTQERASEQARSQLVMRVLQIASDAENGKYPPELNGCVCSGCSHREPWASLKANGCLVFGCFMGAIALGIIALISAFCQDWASMCWLLGIAAALVGIAFLSMKISANRSEKMKPILANLGDIERPVLAPDADALRQKMHDVFAQSPADMEAINEVVANEL